MYFTRSKAVTGHRAAGVLPFSIHEGEVVVLLGAEPCKTGPGGKVWRIMWRAFGGCREAADADSAATAAREFAEETLGLFESCAVTQAGVAAAATTMEAQLRDSSQAVKVIHPLRKGAYHFFCTQTPWVAPLMFRLASQQNAATNAVAGAEKSAFAWVPMKDLLECVAVAAPRYFLEARAHVCGGPGTPPPARCGRRRFQLHPCFANSLRMAQKCGLNELIARAHELPLPPPPPLPPLPLSVPAAEPEASVGGVDAAARAAVGAAASLAAGAESVAGAGAAAAAIEVHSEFAAVMVTGPEADWAAEIEDEGGGWDEVGCDGSGTLQDSLGYWLAQEGIGAALRGSAPATAGADLPSGIWLPQPPPPPLLPQEQQQGQSPQQQRRGRGRGGRQQRRQQVITTTTAAGGAGHGSSMLVSPAASSQPAASGGSFGRTSSVDTASSLRQHREAVAAAAVEQVVQQIELNSRLKQRPSRKQRQKMRRQRQREQAASEAAPAAAAAVYEGEAAEGEAAALAIVSAAPSAVKQQQERRKRRSPQQHEQLGNAGSQAQQERQQQLPVAEAVAGGWQEAVSPPPPPPHWAHAMLELEAAFQPHMRLHKRLRLVVAQ